MGDVPETTWAGSRVMENSAFFGRKKGMKNPPKPGFQRDLSWFFQEQQGKIGIDMGLPIKGNFGFREQTWGQRDVIYDRFPLVLK